MTDARPALAIGGAGGRMGRAIAALAEAEGFRVSGGTERQGMDADGLKGLPGLSEAVLAVDAKEAARGGDVWVDFTQPEATVAALQALATGDGLPAAAVVGTTGLSDAQQSAVSEAARFLAIVQSGNFSLGIALLRRLVREAAARLPAEDWDIEILESHHRDKVDAPSGTALMLGESAADGRGTALSELQTGADRLTERAARRAGDIGFASLRAGGVFGEHSVFFGSRDETLTLSHSALNRDVFARGALRAARWVIGKPPGLYSLDDVLGG